MLFTALLTLHLAGLALGLGGATVGDLMLMRFVLKGEPHPSQLLGYLSQAIWLGVAILGISGVAMFAFQPSTYLHSAGFLAKMIVVAALIGNGVFLHRQIPRLRMNRSTLLSGAISTVSWYSALAIAMFRGHLQLSLVGYLSLYLVAVVVVFVCYAEGYRWLYRTGRTQGVDIGPAVSRRPLRWYRLGRGEPATIERTLARFESLPLTPSEREELVQLRHENWVLRMEKEHRRRWRPATQQRAKIS